jgi:hypothetical protein
MRLAVLIVLGSAAAACDSSLGTPDEPAPIVTVPPHTDADCQMFDPTACRLDVAKPYVLIDVHYPNAFFCRLQILPTASVLDPEAHRRLASSWQVTMDTGFTDTAVVAPETPKDGQLEYDLGTEPLYLMRVTFAATSSETLAAGIAAAVGRSDVSIYAVPLDCTVGR